MPDEQIEAHDQGSPQEAVTQEIVLRESRTVAELDDDGKHAIGTAGYQREYETFEHPIPPAYAILAALHIRYVLYAVL